jgi:D-alanyl-D-alanine carboxypeptidase/D-alanyl-D-alanine-endopeptidase (penicillin-binding protein 4)
MFSQVRTLARGSSEAQYCELDVVPGDLNRYTLTGCLPQRSEPLPLAFAIQDGASYAGAILKAELTQAGITYSGTLLRQTLANEPGTVLATTQSAPLHDLLRIMLKKSDNMIADTVFAPSVTPASAYRDLAGRFRCRTSDPASTGRRRSRQYHHRRRLWSVAPQPDRPGDHDAGAAVYRPARYRAQLHLHAAAGGP